MLSRKRKLMGKERVKPLVTKVKYRSDISEQYRAIRTDIQIASRRKPIRTVLVTSAGPSEGKSITTANLAITFAQQGNKVLLIDADFRLPTLHYTFFTLNTLGLADVLSDDAANELSMFIQPSDIQGLDLLTTGSKTETPSELVSSLRMKEVVESCRQHYDMVFIDTPPVLAVTDAQVLATICDGAILVTRCGQSKIGDTQMAVELLKLSGVSYLGAVLNDVKNKNSHYYYA